MASSSDIAIHPRGKGVFVQTDREAHEEWAQLAVSKPAAAAILHYFAANISADNAVVVSRATLGKVLGISVRTVHRAIDVLAAGHWVQVVRLGAGRECAYRLNDRVAWGTSRDKLRFSHFSARVIANADEQVPETIDGPPLHRLPKLGEIQLPAGEGLPPVSQPFLTGMEPDLPATGRTED